MYDNRKRSGKSLALNHSSVRSTGGQPSAGQVVSSPSVGSYWLWQGKWLLAKTAETEWESDAISIASHRPEEQKCSPLLFCIPLPLSLSSSCLHPLPSFSTHTVPCHCTRLYWLHPIGTFNSSLRMEGINVAPGN